MIIKLADVGSLGWIDDIPAHDLPESPLAWSSARNVIFRSGLAERASGYAAAFDTTPTQAGYGLINAVQADGDAFIVVGCTNKHFSYLADTETDISGSTTVAATADTKYSMSQLTGYIITNESVSAPQFIAIENLATGGTTNVADLTNWPTGYLAKSLRAFKYFLVAGGMTEGGTYYPYKVRWSNSAVPGTLPSSWTATTANDAGSVDLSATDGKIIDMVPFGDQLAIYCDTGITMMRYIGGTDATNRLVMAFNRVPVGANGGMLGLNCGADVSGIGHVVLSNNDVYVFDGQRIVSVLDRKLRNWLFGTLGANRKRSFVVNNSTDSEILICFPQGSDAACTKAISWNYSNEGAALGTRELPNVTAGIHAQVSEQSGTTWATIGGAWSSITPSVSTWNDFPTAPSARKTVFTSTDNKLYVLGNGTTANGSTFTAELQRDYIALGDPERVKYVRCIWPRFEADSAQSLSIAVGTSMSPNETPTWQPERIFTVGTSRKVDVNRAGRYLSLRIRSTSGTPWRIRGLDIDAVPQGAY